MSHDKLDDIVPWICLGFCIGVAFVLYVWN